jgi:hypothetical protein
MDLEMEERAVMNLRVKSNVEQELTFVYKSQFHSKYLLNPFQGKDN